MLLRRGRHGARRRAGFGLPLMRIILALMLMISILAGARFRHFGHFESHTGRSGAAISTTRARVEE